MQKQSSSDGPQGNLFAADADAPLPDRATPRQTEAAWRTLAAQYLSAQGNLHTFDCPVQISVFPGEKGIGQMDVDNTFKAYLNAIVKHGIVRGDNRKWVRSIRGTWIPGMSNAVIRITPAYPAPPIVDVTRHLNSAGRDLVR